MAKKIKPDKKVEETIKAPEPAKVKGKTSIKVSSITSQGQDKPPKPPIEPIPKVSIEPIREKVRREEWECRKCLYSWYPTSPPKKCPNCKSPKISIRKIEEEYKEVPKFDVNLFRPLVAFPYAMWAEKSGMSELNLTPPEIDVLSANLAEVMNYYMTDWMRENGVIVSFLMAVSIVTAPKLYMWKMRKEKVREAEKIQPEEAQPDPERAIETKESVEELSKESPKESLTPTQIEKRLNKAFAGVK